MSTRLPRFSVLILVAGLSLAFGPCERLGFGLPFFRFEAPGFGQLSEAGALEFELRVPRRASIGRLEVELDGQPLDPGTFDLRRRHVSGPLPDLEAGVHLLTATLAIRPLFFLPAFRLHAATYFELIPPLVNADACEVLNQAVCLFPFPSSRFLVPASTPTGYRLALPEVGMPLQFREPVSPAQFSALDGYSPGAQILMNFPVAAGVDLAASGAPVLIEERRTYDDRSLDRDSPTVLVDLDTGERVLHFVELDARQSKPLRQILFLRPAESLVPGHRYGVAVRNLVDGDGNPIPAEPAFAALRDRRPTTIPAVEARRGELEHLFHALRRKARVPRHDLILAFEFVVQSDEGLTGQMLSMRDQSFAWLDGTLAPPVATFSVDESATTERDCSEPGTLIWRIVQGSFQVPLFLTADPVPDPGTKTFLNVDADGEPVQNGFTDPPFTIAIPCAVLDGEVVRPLVIGHGLFGNGRSTVGGLISGDLVNEVAELGLESFPYVAGATDWSGLSSPDVGGPGGVTQSWIVLEVLANLGEFEQLPARLRQGQLNTLMLARMMRQGSFNQHPAFQTPDGDGVFPGPSEQQFYFGASLGGVMGLMFAALSPDVERVNVDVPSTNFEFLLQRATPFLQFQTLLTLTGIGDATEVALGISLIGQLWTRGESAGYARHITSDPLPGTNAKRVLMTEAWLDQQVSNLGTEIAARTLGLPNLKPGSLVSNLVAIPDRSGPLDSALVVYDTGSFDLDDPADAPFVPPLANLQATPNGCDPHGLRGFIPASLLQLLEFFQPGGEIENFCNGDCDAAEPLELPLGLAEPCDPTS